MSTDESLNASSIDPDSMHFVHDFPFDLLHASHNRPIRRFCVAVGTGVLVYLVGLGLAAAINFTSTYVSTPGVYVMVATACYMFSRLNWGVREYASRLNRIAEAFVVERDKYNSAYLRAWKLFAMKLPVFVLFLASFAVITALMAINYFTSPTGMADYFNILRPPTYAAPWFTGSNLAVKFIILDGLSGFALLSLADGLYMTFALIWSWIRIVTPWPVVPVPSYLVIRLIPSANMLLHGTLYYAVGVLAVVVLYGGSFSAPIVITIGAFALIGVSIALFPLIVINSLVERAKSQVASAVAAQYYENIFPAASGRSNSNINTREGGDGASRIGVDVYAELMRLEGLMSATNNADTGVFHLNSLLPVVLSQAIPFLGLLYPALARH